MLAGARRSAIYLGSFLALTTIGSVVIVWSTSSITLSDVSVVSRLVGTIAVAAAALTPVVLQKVLDMSQPEASEYTLERRTATTRSGRLVAGAIVLAVGGFYPATVIAKGWPRFPGSSDCVAPAAENGTVRVVFGYADSYSAALRLRDRARGSGFPSTSVEQDGCGRLRVLIAKPLSRTDAERVVRRAQARAMTPTLELPAAAGTESANSTIANPPRRSSPPVAGTQPNPHGAARVGQTITVDNGRWGGTTPITYSYQWQHCTANAGACTNIASAAAQTITTTSAYVGLRLRAIVTARNVAGSASIASNLSNVVR